MKSSDLKAYLAKAVKKGEPDPFWLVTGTDEFLAVEAGDAIRAAVHGLGYTDRQVLDMSGQSDWSRLAMAAADIGMFDDRKLIEVRLPGGKPGTKGARAIPEYLERPVAGTVTMFTVPAPDWTSAKAAWWTALQKKCTVVDCSAVERRELPAWLRGRLAEKGLSASDETLEFFADLTEGNLFAAAQEIEKLALLCPPGEITSEQIRASVADNSRFDLGTLFECIENGEAERVSRIIDGLKSQDEALPYLLAMLSGEVRSILKLRSGHERGQRFVKGVFAGPALERAAKRLSVRRLENALAVLAKIDRIAKGLPVPDRDSDPWLELKSVALFLAA